MDRPGGRRARGDARARKPAGRRRRDRGLRVGPGIRRKGVRRSPAQPGHTDGLGDTGPRWRARSARVATDLLTGPSARAPELRAPRLPALPDRAQTPRGPRIGDLGAASVGEPLCRLDLDRDGGVDLGMEMDADLVDADAPDGFLQMDHPAVDGLAGLAF